MIGLQWKPDVTLGDVLTVVGFAFTLVSLIFAVREIRRNTLAQRTRFLLDFTERYFSDTDVRRFFYEIDYNRFRFYLTKFTGSDEERWLDSLLYTFDVIGRMIRTGAVTLDEVSIVAFQASRVLGNPEVDKYLKWLDEEYEREGRPGPAHSDARYLMGAIKATTRTRRSKTG